MPRAPRPVPPSPALLREILPGVAGATDLGRLWRAAVRLLQDVAPHHTTFLWADYFDFAQSSKSTLVFEHPAHPRPADYWEGRRRHHLTAGYLQAHAGLKLYRMTEVVPRRNIRKSAFYQLYMQPEGWEYAVTLAFWHRDHLRATIALYRTAAQGDFRAHETVRLGEWHALLERSLFRLLDQQQNHAMHQALEEFLQGLPIGLLLLNWDLQPAFINQEGYDLALRWNLGPDQVRSLNSRRAFVLPTAFAEACEQMKSDWVEALVPGTPPPDRLVQRLSHPTAAGLRAIMCTQTVHSVSPSRPCFLVRLTGEPLGIAASGRLEQRLELLNRLSAAERRTALLLCDGLSNAEIATRLGKEVSTVKTQLTSIFTKLGVQGRGRVSALLRT